ncbi:unnamed protein product [Linum tenue]|uniref:Uncharacterized protein n=1 Tax=Linum tenue TaxID=586396 RepID=A0AAV0IZ68_9ROSI|nr:unnamed protein product [Linum tenue]
MHAPRTGASATSAPRRLHLRGRGTVMRPTRRRIRTGREQLPQRLLILWTGFRRSSSRSEPKSTATAGEMEWR